MINLVNLMMFNSIPEILGNKTVILDDTSTTLCFSPYNIFGLDLENCITIKTIGE
jgi:hypothetical protein